MATAIRSLAFYGYIGSGNLGNDASFETCLDWFRVHHPEVQLSCITIAPHEVSERYGIRAYPLSWHTETTVGGRVKSVARKALRRILDVPRTFRLAGVADAVMVPGMGVLEDALGTQPWGMPLSLFLIATACRLRGRRFVMFDVGANYVRNPLSRLLQLWCVLLAAHVSYRDEESAEAMRRSGDRPGRAVAPDVAFAHPAPTAGGVEPGRVTVGAMAYYGPSDNPRRGRQIQDHYVSEMAAVLTELIGTGSRISIVGGDGVDIAVARRIEEATRERNPGLDESAIAVREFTTFSDLSDEVARAELVVASRFHNLICALRLGRPAISVGYAEKSRHLLQALGVLHGVHDIPTLSSRGLLADIARLRSDLEPTSARLQSEVAAYKQRIDGLLRGLSHAELGLGPGRDAVNGAAVAGRPLGDADQLFRVRNATVAAEE